MELLILAGWNIETKLEESFKWLHYLILYLRHSFINHPKGFYSNLQKLHKSQGSLANSHVWAIHYSFSKVQSRKKNHKQNMSLSCTEKGVSSNDNTTLWNNNIRSAETRRFARKVVENSTKGKLTGYGSKYRLSRTTRALVTRPNLQNFFSKSRSVMA